jgi:hypothetical protein
MFRRSAAENRLELTINTPGKEWMYYDTGRYFNDMQGFSNNCSDDCRTLPCAQSDYRIGNIRFTGGDTDT